MQPLADKLRPRTLDDIIGQSHIIGEGKILNKLLENNSLKNCILYGPPGCGKTSVASIIASKTNRRHIKLNAINCGVKEIKDAIEASNKDLFSDGVILQLEEIQALNKKQQQSLLEVLEDGRVILIASTTENPYFSVFKAILSRSIILEFKMLSSNDIYLGLIKAIERLQLIFTDKDISFEEEALQTISNCSNGDMRYALNLLSTLFDFSTDSNTCKIELSLDNLNKCNISGIVKYDNGDTEYSLLSALHKSLRGSCPTSACHYLARLIHGGGSSSLLPICRRLLCVAAEDIGVCNPQAIVITQSCVAAALQLGYPEARLPLAEAAIYLSLSPKSFSTIRAIDSALQDLDTIDPGDIPDHLKDAHYSGAKDLGRGVDYKFPHDYPNNYVEQDYLPKNLKDRVYYVPGNNKNEMLFKEYWDNIKSL